MYELSLILLAGASLSLVFVVYLLVRQHYAALRAKRKQDRLDALRNPFAGQTFLSREQQWTAPVVPLHTAPTPPKHREPDRTDEPDSVSLVMAMVLSAALSERNASAPAPEPEKVEGGGGSFGGAGADSSWSDSPSSDSSSSSDSGSSSSSSDSGGSSDS